MAYSENARSGSAFPAAGGPLRGGFQDTNKCAPPVCEYPVFSDRSREYEGTVIGAIIMRGSEVIAACSDGGLTADCFTDPLAARAFTVAEEMAADGRDINLSTLITEVLSRNLVDGPDIVSLSEMGMGLTGREDLTPYVSSVVEFARKRRIMQTAAAVANGDDDAVDALRAALEAADADRGAVRTRDPLTHRVREILESADGIITTDQICRDLSLLGSKDRAKARTIMSRFKGTLVEPATGRAGTWRIIRGNCEKINFALVKRAGTNLWMPFGLSELNTIHPGDIVLICGDPNSGKTALLLWICAENVKRGWKVHYYNSEMSPDMKFTPMQMTAEASQAAEQMKMSMEDVARAFHYPLFKLGGPLPTTSGGVEAVIMMYYTDCLQQHIEAIETCLDNGLGLSGGLHTELDLDGLIRMDTVAMYDANNKAVGGGWMKPNEARFKANMAPVEGGDTPYLQQQNFSLAALNKRDQQENPFASSSTNWARDYIDQQIRGVYRSMVTLEGKT